MTPVSLPRSREERVTLDGDDYRILLAWPAAPPPEAGFPIVYVLDANAAFATVVEAIRMRSHRPDATGVGDALAVGVAYPGDAPYARDRRTFDYTRPRTDPAPEDGGDGRPVPKLGGAERFLRFLGEEVSAIASRDHPIDRTQRTIIGHSMAGFFVLQTLVTTPTAFDTYVAISPSIWWDRPSLMAGAEALTVARLQARITVGEYEQKLAPWQVGRPPQGTVAERREDRRMIDHARELAQVLARRPEARVEFEVLAREDHASVVPPSISEGLRFAFNPDRGRRMRLDESDFGALHSSAT